MQSTELPPTPPDHPAATAAAVAAAKAKVANPTPELAEAIQRGYEPKDVSLRGLFIFLGTLVVSLIVVLIAIYGIMMALIQHDRSRDALGATVAVAHPEVYAPLQPSVGHPTDDWVDMITMRQQTFTTLTTSGVTATGRRYVPITQAIEMVQPKLLIGKNPPKPFEPRFTYGAGSYEGHYVPPAGRVETAETRAAEHPKH